MADAPHRRPPARRPALTMPARAGILLGASAAVYAVSLAAVAGLQSHADAEVAAERRPAIEGVAAARAAADALDCRLRAADAALHDLAAGYQQTGGDVDAFSARLDVLAGLVDDVEGSAAALPTRIHLPTVSVRTVPAGTSVSNNPRPPRTSGRSGASGG